MVDWKAARKRAAAALEIARRRHRSGHPHPEPEPHREVAGRDRAGARRRGRDPGARRADREPARRRGGAALHGAAAAPRPRRRHDLRLAPARRSVRDRRPHGGAARRPRRRRAPARRRRRRRRRSCSSSAASRRRSSAGRRSARATRGSSSKAMTVEGVGPVDCAIHAGEVVGLVGLRGAGQESIGRALFGLLPITGGASDARRQRRLPPRRPARPWRAGINLVCADRAGESVMPNLSVRENLFLNPLAAGLGLFSYLAPGRENEASRELGRRVGLRPNDPSLADRAPLRRQPAEGRRRALAAPREQGLRLRGSDRRRRRRRQGRDLPALRRRAPGGRGDHHHLDRFRGGRQGLPPRAGLRPRPRRRRARRRRPFGRESACRGLGARGTDGGTPGSRNARRGSHAVH